MTGRDNMGFSNYSEAICLAGSLEYLLLALSDESKLSSQVRDSPRGKLSDLLDVTG